MGLGSLEWNLPSGEFRPGTMGDLENREKLIEKMLFSFLRGIGCGFCGVCFRVSCGKHSVLHISGLKCFVVDSVVKMSWQNEVLSGTKALCTLLAAGKIHKVISRHEKTVGFVSAKGGL